LLLPGALVFRPADALGQPPVVRTERLDLPGGDLGLVGLELVLDYFVPPVPARVVNTRFDLTFETETPAGSFDAADIGLILQPPIDDPLAPDDRVLTLFRTGADFGWSGTGTFTFTGQTDALNGPLLPAPPGAGALLYGLVLFHADRLTDPNDLSPLGGRFVDSFIEVDYVVVPEPTAAALCWLIAPLAGLFSRQWVRHSCGGCSIRRQLILVLPVAIGYSPPARKAQVLPSPADVIDGQLSHAHRLQLALGLWVRRIWLRGRCAGRVGDPRGRLVRRLGDAPGY
jgi:hypothetical protein